MAREEVLMTKYTCDGCGKEHVVPEDESPIPWFEGEAIHQHVGGTYGAEWGACSTRCIGRAVRNALQREDQQQSGQQSGEED